MPVVNERHVSEMVEASIAEMMQIQGGAVVDYYLKIDTIDGEATNSASAGRYSDWRQNFGRTS